jgi:hypothetical protein
VEVAEGMLSVELADAVDG